METKMEMMTDGRAPPASTDGRTRMPGTRMVHYFLESEIIGEVTDNPWGNAADKENREGATMKSDSAGTMPEWMDDGDDSDKPLVFMIFHFRLYQTNRNSTFK